MVSGDDAFKGEGVSRRSGADEGDLTFPPPSLENRGSFSCPIKLRSAGDSSSLLEGSSKVEELPSCRDSATETFRS